MPRSKSKKGGSFQGFLSLLDGCSGRCRALRSKLQEGLPDSQQVHAYICHGVHELTKENGFERKADKHLPKPACLPKKRSEDSNCGNRLYERKWLQL